MGKRIQATMATYEHHVFICTNERDKSAKRGSCGREGAEDLKSAMKSALKHAGLKHRVRVNEVGCLDQCEHGPVMVVYPDAVWYGFVREDDVKQIVTEHLEGGLPVERLRVADSCLNAKRCPHMR